MRITDPYPKDTRRWLLSTFAMHELLTEELGHLDVERAFEDVSLGHLARERYLDRHPERPNTDLERSP